MKFNPLRTMAAFVLCGLLAAAATTIALAAGRSDAEILKEYDAVALPKFDQDKQGDKAYIQGFRESYMKAQERRDELAWELFLAKPDHKKVPKLLLERWPNRMMNPATAGATADEIDRAMPAFTDKKMARTASFMKVVAIISKDREHPLTAMPAIDKYILDDPKDERCPMLLGGFASGIKDTKLKTDLLKRLIAAYPSSPQAQSAEKFLILSEKIGKPFKLAFEDAVKGSHVSIEGLKGKVVVLDFWATWCGPCIAEMPKMKALYAEYHPKGVEFIGVSLDDSKEKGGLDKLKDFVAKNEIPWPQYHQGNGWESDFSADLGINSIPQLFLVDADGKLAEIDARGKLETLLPEYLAKAKGKANSGGGQ